MHIRLIGVSVRLIGVAVAALPFVAGCGQDGVRVRPAGEWSSAPAPSAPPDPPATATSTATSPAGTATPDSPVPSACQDGWDCAQRARFEAAAAYAANRRGQLGVVMRDRQTGAVWRAGATRTPMWTGSTIKLAIATFLLERQRAGAIHLTDADRRAMSDMLRSSSNDATDTLWNRYDGPGMLDRFRAGYGMASLSVVAGRETYWRNLRCTAEDLDHLMSYVLGDHLHADDRAYLVETLRGVADNQHWGVWAAGPTLRPGNKDGWALKPDSGGEHWVTHTVGFAGPTERCVVVVMYSQPPGGTLSAGVHAVSDVVALLFGGQTPAKVSVPA
ncbi:tat pathway signal sequence [Planosporangium thailandense]|uniref:Tat pathway signal sequence n=1 Tax=Planosporangium thailandense TaxID=765197 RepID=A0ABX0XZE6_9ACTN|nr:tat pathway signal sequence [Planosporangium thailandense]NJC70568.1 tat pathway signal sequence [Planosporangium thailandense]